MTPYLTDEELAEICASHTQGAAQIRLLRRWGIKVERKPNGRPLIRRHDWLAWRLCPLDQPTPTEPAWRHAETEIQ